MTEYLVAILYLITSVALLTLGLDNFATLHKVLSPSNPGIPYLAREIFAGPTIFFLASTSEFWKGAKIKASSITAAATLVILLTLFGHYGIGWKPFLVAAGPLVSAIYILRSLVQRTSAIVAIGAIIYGLIFSSDLSSKLYEWWNFGGAITTLFVILLPHLLVMTSVAIAGYSYVRARTSKNSHLRQDD